MKISFQKFIYAGLTTSMLCFSALVPAQTILENSVIFKLKDNPPGVIQLKKMIEQEFPFITVEQIWQKFPPSPTKIGLAKRKQNPSGTDLERIYEFKYNGKVRPSELALQLAVLENISYAQPHFIPAIAFIPDDEFLSRLEVSYNLIQTFEGWDISTGDTNMIIGLTDTGTDTDHPDLISNFSFNYNDPIDSVDNDQDGYIDNFLGWDLAENDNNVQSEISHHGVHMSGLIGAVPNNGIGIAGTGYSCHFLPIKIADDSTGALVAAYEGIKYAADAGCDIINCSWGGYFVGEFERDVVDYALNVKNCLVIAAAGNDDDNALFFPAAFNGVLAVASTDMNDEKMFNSNYHSDIDITAPGEKLYATWNNGLYQSLSGTSVATAIVSGIAGIVKSHYPQMTNPEVIELLKNSSNYIYDKNQAYTNMLGNGRVNLLRALAKELTPEFKDLPIRIFPNPVNSAGKGIANVYVFLPEEANLEVAMISMNGNKTELYQQSFNSSGVLQIRLDAAKYAPGVYFVRMVREKEVFYEKVVIL